MCHCYPSFAVETDIRGGSSSRRLLARGSGNQMCRRTVRERHGGLTQLSGLAGINVLLKYTICDAYSPQMAGAHSLFLFDHPRLSVRIAVIAAGNRPSIDWPTASDDGKTATAEPMLATTN